MAPIHWLGHLVLAMLRTTTWGSLVSWVASKHSTTRHQTPMPSSPSAWRISLNSTPFCFAGWTPMFRETSRPHAPTIRWRLWACPRLYFTEVLPQVTPTHTITETIANKPLSPLVGTNQPVTDVLYTAQVGTGSVSFVRSTVSGSGPGPRYGHSAVLYGSNTVLILGGVDTTGTAKNDVNVYHHLRKAWQTSFSTTETYFSTSVGSPASGTASRTAPTPTSCVNCGSARQPLTFGEQEGIAAGVSTGGLVVSIDNRTTTRG